MGLILLAVMMGAVAAAANGQDDSPLLWGAITLVLCLVGGAFGGLIGMLVAGAASFGLLQLKIAKWG
ncbi:MAG: hypothetical protein KDA84_10100 [Planctomycetaceae bacterium]|nr:hypothetical protein [Planctomycetaceae bacterium]